MFRIGSPKSSMLVSVPLRSMPRTYRFRFETYCAEEPIDSNNETGPEESDNDSLYVVFPQVFMKPSICDTSDLR